MLTFLLFRWLYTKVPLDENDRETDTGHLMQLRDQKKKKKLYS